MCLSFQAILYNHTISSVSIPFTTIWYLFLPALLWLFLMNAWYQKHLYILHSPKVQQFLHLFIMDMQIFSRLYVACLPLENAHAPASLLQDIRVTCAGEHLVTPPEVELRLSKSALHTSKIYPLSFTFLLPHLYRPQLYCFNEMHILLAWTAYKHP